MSKRLMKLSPISELGGEHSVRDIGLRQSMTARPEATFDNQELYANIFDKAAALMKSLVNNRPFVDSKKHTGIACTVLSQNGITFSVENSDLQRFMLCGASSKSKLFEMAKWLKNHYLAIEYCKSIPQSAI